MVCRKPGCFAGCSAAVQSRVWFLWINITRQKNMTHASKKPAAFFPREENPRVAVAGSGLGWRVEDQRSPGLLQPPVWTGMCEVWLWAAVPVPAVGGVCRTWLCGGDLLLLETVLLGWLRLLTPVKRREPVNEGKALSYAAEISNWLHMDRVRCRAFPEGDGMRSDVGLMKEARH